jgi:hypothetical protein
MGDTPEVGEMRSLHSSPAPTEVVSDSEEGDSGPTRDALPQDPKNVDGDHTEDDANGGDESRSGTPEDLRDGEELPSLVPILRGEAWVLVSAMLAHSRGLSGFLPIYWEFASLLDSV